MTILRHKNRPRQPIRRAWAALAAALACASPLASSADAQAMQQRVAEAGAWLNAALSSAPGSSSPSLQMQVLPMDDSSYRRYAARAHSEELAPLIGRPALSAFYQAGGMVDGKALDVCFMLYNPGGSGQLDALFVAPFEEAHGPALAPYLFLAAHELGHCIEFQRAAKSGSPSRAKLSMEISADIFAIFALRKAGVPAEQIEPIISSRKSAAPSHRTWAWAHKALSMPLPGRGPAWIEDAWRLAARLGSESP